MAFAFRISSFDFNLFDFLRRNSDRSHHPQTELQPIITPSTESDQFLIGQRFDLLSEFITKDQPTDITNDYSTSAAQESVESESRQDDQNVSNADVQNNRPNGGKRHKNFDDIDEVTRDIRRKFRHEYREVKNAYTTNITYQLSHTDMMDSQIYMSRFQNNNSELNIEEENFYEKEKEKQENDLIAKDEIRKKVKE